jgi:Bacterial Ig domain/Dockerin type I domain
MPPQFFHLLGRTFRGGQARRRRRPKGSATSLCRLLIESLEERTLLAAAWSGYAHDAQHTAVSSVASQPLQGIAWQTPVDLAPQYTGEYLLIHYGSPLVTAANTVIVPVKTGATDGFQVEGISGATGALKWTQSTDYVLPPHSWVPSYSPTLTPNNRLYFAGAGGTVYYINAPDADGATTTGQLSFYGMSAYSASKATFDSAVFINTPITSDSAGNIYFGFEVTGPNPSNLQSGIARIDTSGNGTWISAAAATGDANVTKVLMNAAPALSNDGKTLYAVLSQGSFSSGYLVALDSGTLSGIGASGTQVRLKDPNGTDAILPDIGSASPTIGPNGDVFFGVLENPFPYNHDRGWLLHFSGDLSRTFAPGAFGWDDTASIVPASMVPSYSGTSSYLLMTKYNNYAGAGGNGVNKLGVVDPTATQTDPITGTTVMKEVLTIAGLTPDEDFVGSFPNAVREWCINTAAVDPFTGSILANSEDGKLYRWDLATNTFTEQITLTSGVGEAYTPTIIGVDGTVFAINNATLFAIRSAGNHAPVADNLAVTLAEDSSFSVTLSATDADNNPLTFSIETGPAHGTLTGNAPNLTYTPSPDYNGGDSFVYRAFDGARFSAPATVSLTITPVNDAPTFAKGPDQQATDESGPQHIAGWATAIAPGPPNEIGQTVQFIVLSNTNPGIFADSPVVDANGSLSFTPAPNARGTSQITLALQDSGGTENGGKDTSAPQSFLVVVTKPHPWHNTENALDVTHDGHVVAADVLLIISYLNASGPNPVPANAAVGPPYYDVTGDDHVAPNDALAVINYINAFGIEGEAPSARVQNANSSSALVAQSSSDELISLLAADIASQPRRRPS